MRLRDSSILKLLKKLELQNTSFQAGKDKTRRKRKQRVKGRKIISTGVFFVCVSRRIVFERKFGNEDLKYESIFAYTITIYSQHKNVP